jgi:hypothetical protein
MPTKEPGLLALQPGETLRPSDPARPADLALGHTIPMYRYMGGEVNVRRAGCVCTPAGGKERGFSTSEKTYTLAHLLRPRPCLTGRPGARTSAPTEKRVGGVHTAAEEVKTVSVASSSRAETTTRCSKICPWTSFSSASSTSRRPSCSSAHSRNSPSWCSLSSQSSLAGLGKLVHRL